MMIARFATLLCPLLLLTSITACQKTPTTQSSDAQGQSSAQSSAAEAQDTLTGCYTVNHTEPAQIKISKHGDNYSMQMRQYNDPSKDWDTPTPMQVLANDNPEIGKYFDIKAGESKFLEKVIARPDRVFVLAKITDSFASLNPQYDSPYLGYIYKASNTVYKVSCAGGKAV